MLLGRRVWRFGLDIGVVEGGFWRCGIDGGGSVDKSFWMALWREKLKVIGFMVVSFIFTIGGRIL